MDFSISSYIISELLSRTGRFLYDTLFSENIALRELENKVNTMHDMVEDVYTEGFKSFFDFLKLKEPHKAIDALIRTSNLRCTPVANLLLATLLYKANRSQAEIELAKSKIINVFHSNPFLFEVFNNQLPENLKHFKINLLEHVIKITPEKINPTFWNYLTSIPLGIIWTNNYNRAKISTSGKYLIYEIYSGYNYTDDGVYHTYSGYNNLIGAINLDNGWHVWKKKNDSRFLFATPAYVVLQEGYSPQHTYKILDINTGNTVVIFSENTFNLCFSANCYNGELYNKYNKIINLDSEDITHMDLFLSKHIRAEIHPFLVKSYIVGDSHSRGTHDESIYNFRLITKKTHEVDN
jgi:hypothetical protein